MGFSRPVRADQAESLTVMDLVIEGKKEIVDGDPFDLGDAPSGVRATQPNVNALIGDRRWRRSGGHELFPASLGGIGLGRVLEVLSGALLHDLHVVEESTFFVVPSLQVVSELFLAPGSCLGKRGVRATVDPRTRTLDHHDLGGDSLE